MYYVVSCSENMFNIIMYIPAHVASIASPTSSTLFHHNHTGLVVGIRAANILTGADAAAVDVVIVVAVSTSD